jgi:hypothetical protein
VRFVYRRFAALQAGDFGGVGIDAGDVVPKVGKARSRNRPHISGSNYSDSHGRRSGGVIPVPRV